jgi:PRC-barrel domain
MLESYSHEQLRELVGHEVRDSNGESVGYVDVAFNDVESGTPEWMGIWNGLPGGKRHLVPLRNIARDRDEIVLPWMKEEVESAPTYDEEDERGVLTDDQTFGISQEKEEAAYRHYGLEPPARARTGAVRLRVWSYTERAGTVVQ